MRSPCRTTSSTARTRSSRPSGRSRCGSPTASSCDGLSAPPVLPLLLASTSPQRRAILDQLGIPFDVVAPRYEERGDAGLGPVELVRAHAEGKARSVAAEARERPVLGVDTAVVLGDAVLGKPEGEGDAVDMLTRLGGQTHVVVSGLCLLAPGWEVVDHAETRVTFRDLTPRDVARYVVTDEWRNRAGAYAIQAKGAALVEHIEGDYLNVVGLPAALLIGHLADHFPGAYNVA